jgi:hypothetical protein
MTTDQRDYDEVPGDADHHAIHAAGRRVATKCYPDRSAAPLFALRTRLLTMAGGWIPGRQPLRLPVGRWLAVALVLAAAAQATADERAFRDLQAAAAAGDAAAQFDLGYAYFHGKGVARDLAASTRWFAAAARQGLPEAQFNLGNAYRHGRGVAADPDQAVRWWWAAAHQGVANASHNLAVHYLQRQRTTAERELGLAWLDRAAAGGLAEARRALSQLDGAMPAAGAPTGPGREPLSSEAALLTLPAGHYVVQLLAAGSLDAARQFISTARLGARARIFRLPKARQLLWIVVYGDYPDRGEAQDAIDVMRPQLKRHAPWARPLAEIQALIRTVWERHEGTRLSVVQ